MEIDVFAICYNEEKMLPYFMRYYSQFANTINIYDNFSTDKSRNIIMEYNNVSIIPYDSNNQIRDDIYLEIKNSCYKNSKADWVIVCDIDEFVYHPNLLEALENSKATVIRPAGYEMFSENFPSGDSMIFDQIKTGIPYPNSSKTCLFKPDVDINFTPGCHLSNPTGNVILDENSEIKLLHYKHLSRDYVIERYRNYVNRLSDINKKKKWGYHYSQTENEINKWFDKNLSIVENVVD